MNNKKTTTLRMPLHIYKKLKECSDKLGISVHECIMLAINHFVQRILSDTDE